MSQFNGKFVPERRLADELYEGADEIARKNMDEDVVNIMRKFHHMYLVYCALADDLEEAQEDLHCIKIISRNGINLNRGEFG